MAELLIWPALLAYGEAALVYAGGLRVPRLGGTLGIWGVRVGWLAQTALLVVQGLRADGFPWGSWAGALNLFVWFVVGVYLVWGCNARFRLLGALVMPPAAALLVASWLGGGTGIENGVQAGALLAAHVGLMLAGLAGLAVAAGMSTLYLWEDRSLTRRDSRLFRLRMPPLDALDRIAARVAAVSLGLLSGGIVLGLARLRSGEFDASMAVTICLWVLVATVLALRLEVGLRGRRAATLLTAMLVLIAAVLPITHFAS
jgi:ABC-type uncharacterized transport system permease subunit